MICDTTRCYAMPMHDSISELVVEIRNNKLTKTKYIKTIMHEKSEKNPHSAKMSRVFILCYGTKKTTRPVGVHLRQVYNHDPCFP